MEANGSVNLSDSIDDDIRPEDSSSRLSLGSSPSELSEEEDDVNPTNPDDDFPLDDGDGSLTPTDKIIMDDDDDEDNSIVVNRQPPQEFDDDGLFEDSSDTLSNAPMDIDEREDDEDEEEPFSSLSSVPAPLSPEPHHHHLQNEDEENEEEAEQPSIDQELKEEEDCEEKEEVPKSKKRRAQQQQKGAEEEEEDEEDEEEEEEEVEREEEKQEPSPPPALPSRRDKRAAKKNKNGRKKKTSGNNSTATTATTSGEENSSSTPTDTPIETHSTSKENEKPLPLNAAKKRRGSVALEQEEWQQRRTSKLLENKEAMAGLANALENAEEQQSSSESPQLPASSSSTSEQKVSVKEEEENTTGKDKELGIIVSSPTEITAEAEGISSSNNDNEDNAGGKDIIETSTNGQQSTSSDDKEKQDRDNAGDQRSQKSQLQQEHQEEEGRVANNRNENDDQEYQRWHGEALDALTRIEVEFARLRDKMYQEKMSELNEEALMIASGTHPELVTMMETIEKKKNERIQTAEAWRKHKRVSYQHQFEGLEYQANIDFVSGKHSLRRNILGSLNRKRWDLDHERDKLNEPLTDADRVPDPALLQQRKRLQLDESRDLQRITQSVGFPVAPRTTGIAAKSVEDDLIALGIIDAPSTSSTSQEKNVDSSNTSNHHHHHHHHTSKSNITGTSSSIQHHHHQAAGRPASSTNTTKKVLDMSLNNNAYHPTAHVYTFQGQLHYHGQIYRKGDQFTVVDANAGRYNAKLLTATDTEVHIQRTDGSKTKLPFIQMTRGKYQIYPKHS